MIWLIIISIVLIAGVLGFLKILVTKKYLIHQYNLGVGVQYRDFTKSIIIIIKNEVLTKKLL